jgi:hypothetical protein
METILIDRLLSILNVFCAQTSDGMSKNQICQKVCQHTSVRNKGPIFKAIKLLIKEKILDAKFVNKVKELVTPTSLGTEIIDFIIDINATNEAYLAVERKIVEYARLIGNSKKLLRSLLLQKGWKDKELDSFKEIFDALFNMRHVYLKSVCNSLLHRYFAISSKFKINDIANAVLVRILFGGITNLLNSRPVQNIIYPSVALNSSFEDLQGHVLYDINQKYYICRQFISNRFISEEITRLMSSLICVLKPSPDSFFRLIHVISSPEEEKSIKGLKEIKVRIGNSQTKDEIEQILTKKEIEQLEYNNQLERVRVETIKRYPYIGEQGAKT